MILAALKTPLRNLIIFFMLTYCTPGWAFIPPSEFILNTWATKHSIGTRAIKLRNVITAYDQGKPNSVHFKETVIYFPGGTLVSIATDDNDQKLYSTEKTIDSLPPISKAILTSDLGKLTESLKSVGIPIRSKEELLALATESDRILAESESLVRVNGQLTSLAWVISSAKSSQIESKEPLPQIWFEKDTFNLLKIAYQEPRDQTFYEFQLEDFRSFREFIYPKTFQTKKGDTILFSTQMQDLWISNPESLGAKAFQSQYSETGYSDLGKNASGSVKDLIQRYYGIIR